MAIPEVTQVWTYRSNVIVPEGASVQESCRRTLRTIKDEMVTNLGWSVAFSCNASTVNASDLWISDGALVWGSSVGTRSWIVLNHPLGAQLLIELSWQATNYYWSGAVLFSEGGLFVGGSTTVRPTATDEVRLIGTAAGAGWPLLNVNSTVRRVLHFWQSSDARHFRMLHCASGSVYTSVFLEKPVGANPTTTGWVSHAEGSTNHLTYAIFQRTVLFGENRRLSAKNLGGTLLGALFTTECMMGVGVGERWTTQNLDGAVPMAAIKLFAPTVGGYYTRVGPMVDMWMGPTAFANTGDTYSDALGNPRKFIQFNHVILPWDGTIPEVA